MAKKKAAKKKAVKKTAKKKAAKKKTAVVKPKKDNAVSLHAGPLGLKTR